MEQFNRPGTGDDTDAETFRNIEYLEVDSASEPRSEQQPSFEDLSSENDAKNPLYLDTPPALLQDDDESSRSVQSLTQEEAVTPLQDGDGSGPSVQSMLPRGEPTTEFNVTVNLSAKEFKQYAFHFVGKFYVRSFKTQRLADPVYTKDVIGNTIEELLQCLWENCSSLVSREVVVDQTQEEKSVFWSTKEKPDHNDINKFIVLRHQKTKRLYSIEDLRDGSKILSSWRGKPIQVHIYKYSTSVTSSTIWELVNKCLLQLGQKDRAGAPTTEELFNCVSELKETHIHYTALHSSWVKWANFILSQPGDQHSSLVNEAPPDEYLHLFRAPPISEGSQLQVTRRGYQIAFSICDTVTSDVNRLCDVVDNLAKEVTNAQLLAHQLKAKVENSHSLLEAMQSSMPPEESEFSKKLASSVGDMVDVDHNE